MLKTLTNAEEETLQVLLAQAVELNVGESMSFSPVDCPGRPLVEALACLFPLHRFEFCQMYNTHELELRRHPDLESLDEKAEWVRNKLAEEERCRGEAQRAAVARQQVAAKAQMKIATATAGFSMRPWVALRKKDERREKKPSLIARYVAWYMDLPWIKRIT